MTKRRWMLAHRHARFLQRDHRYRAMAEDLAGIDSIIFVGDDDEPLVRGSVEYMHYRDWLMANAIKKGNGRKMHRALIRAEQKYNKLKREHRGLPQLRQRYPAKWR